MKEQSLWTRYSDEISFPRLIEDRTFDVAIIGGGMCGIMTAALLKRSGLRVGVFEARRIGRSSTGFSTGNLYEVLSDELYDLVDAHGDQKGRQLVESRREAITLIEEMIHDYGIDCDFRRVSRYFYSSIKDKDGLVDREARVQGLLGTDFTWGEFPESRLKARCSVTNENQAQFNPQRFVEQLAEKIDRTNIEIYEDTRIEEVNHEGDRCMLKTDEVTITATKVIHATHTPKGLMTYHTLLAPYREYGLAFELNGREHTPGIFFGHFDDKSHFSTRGYEARGKNYLIVVGGPHKVGQGNSVEEVNRLEAFARSHFDVSALVDVWGAQQYKSTDYIPYIGPKGKGEEVYIATGFSSHGLTYSAVAAQILSDAINGVENKYADLYSPSRLNPLISAPSFIKENANVFYEYLNDYLLKNYSEEMQSIEDNCGKVISFEGKKVAVSRDEDGKLHVCSGVCPHLGGIVHWNAAESTWDCPLHGSRFSPAGEVLEGPSFTGLKKYELTDLEEEIKPTDWINPAAPLIISDQTL